MDLVKIMTDLSDQQRFIAMTRAMKKHGVDYQLAAVDMAVIAVDTNELTEDPEFLMTSAEECLKIAMQETLDKLVEDDILEASGIDENGHIEYGLTPLGQIQMEVKHRED